MPAAPIAKGPYHPHYYNQPIHPINKTNTTIAKSGVIIMCAVLIAAGYTVYENREQVKELVDRTRRKISLAMHTFAEEIMPPEPRQRQPMAFSGRSLEGSGNLHRAASRPSSRARSRRNSADSITLRGDDEKAEGSSRDAYLADSALRHRPPYRGFSFDEPEPSSLSNTKNPFDDDNRVLFDAAAESAPQQQHTTPKKSSSPSSDTLSDRTLSPAISEKRFPLSNDDAPPMIPAVLPIPPTHENVIDQPPQLPPRPSHPHYEGAPSKSQAPEPTVAAAVVADPQPPAEEPEEPEEHHTTFSTSQPYWAIQQWTEDITGTPDVDDHAGDLSSSDEVDAEDEDHSAVQSLHSESEATSVIGSDEGESEIDDRVEFVSDMASSIGDTDGWSEVGSQFSEAERM
ncbi:hypothetical protein H072_2542 [Dactylellina haptotyla CBS 200.50]|uniref:Uncharacterized protein n=1 Tax=Dactylellina haptotyla (strain CBS 200.50) TaxID=1284197 RepID=S8AKM4_DACHA|nr:hypothetical protein H072_2542 [Dactylellina haptotyla CBS 200.50]